MEDGSESPTFGLVTGLGIGAGIFFYRSLVAAHLALGLSPRILMVHADVRRTMDLAAQRRSRDLAVYLSSLLKQLAEGGAASAAIPAFSPQVCAPQLAAMTPLPLIGLLDAVVAEVSRRNLQRLAIFGARVTMETKLFGALPDQDIISPKPDEVDLISGIYQRIVEQERASVDERNTLQDLAHKIVDRERLDAILLAGTDLAFVFAPETTTFPHVDGARTHLNAIMQRLCAKQ